MQTTIVDATPFEAGLRRAARMLAVAGVVVLLAQSASIVADALSRWLFNSPIPGMEDINIVLIAVTVATFMPALFIERGNITVNLLGHAAGTRVSTWLDAFGHLLAFLFIVLLAWQYFLYAVDLGPTYTVILELPKQPGALVVSLLLAASALLQGMVLWSSLQLALAGGQARGTR